MSLLGENRLKLGVFATNLDGGLTATTAPERHRLTWPTVKRVAGLADAAGFELQVPLARWRGLGGVTNFNGCNYEPLTWAAGVSAATSHSNVFATIHVPVIHPIVAAKQMTTVDHIANGRFGLNLVCGWFPAEFAMFGAPMMDHSKRYEYAAEWLQIVRRLWTEQEEFSFEGSFFRIEKGQSQPKPIRQPMPPVMNAGQSPTGAHFAARYADVGFLSIAESEPFDVVRAKFAALRRLAREEYHRDIEIWTSCWVICRPTQVQAQRFRDYCILEHGDAGAVDGLPPEVLPPKGTPPEILEQFRIKARAGFGGLHVVGTPDQVADRLKEIAALGADGIVLSWVNYEEGITTFSREVMPRLEAAGLRRPFVAGAA